MPDDSQVHALIGANGRVLACDFRPHPLLRHRHQQTVAPTFLRPRPELSLRIERCETPDGDFVDVGWAGGTHGPIAILVHGLGGGFESKYLRGLARLLVERGWRVAALQLRGGGAEPNRLPRCYHHGDTGDLRWLWQRLRAGEPQVPIAAVGWSMGGNLLLRALSEEAGQTPLLTAVAACVPFSLADCARHMNRGFARIYQAHLLRGLHDIVRRKQAAGSVPDWIDVPRALAAPSFIEFDDAFTAPLNGFRDASDYYDRTSCGPILKQIQTPTLIVHAQDDPFMTAAIIPSASALSPAVTLELATHGGHVGFVSTTRQGLPHWWLEHRIADHLQRALDGSRPAASS